MKSSFPVRLFILSREVSEWTRRNYNSTYKFGLLDKWAQLVNLAKHFKLVKISGTFLTKLFFWVYFDLLLNNSDKHFRFEVWFLTASKKIIILLLHQKFSTVRKHIFQRKQTMEKDTFSLASDVDVEEFMHFSMPTWNFLDSFMITFFKSLNLKQLLTYALADVRTLTDLQRNIFL